LYKKDFFGGKGVWIKSVRFNGLSEPLLSNDLAELITEAREHGVIDTFITTNAMLLNKETSRKLITSGLNHILVSIDGSTAKTYEKIRVGAHYPTVVENLYGLLEEREKLGSKLPLIRLTFVKMKINEHEINEFVENWINIVDYIGIAGYLISI
jgi:MoaA/NifB/PqqE/SkfB family radical SAM enzyme